MLDHENQENREGGYYNFPARRADVKQKWG